METWRELSALPTFPSGTFVTLGNFDGVHQGHQAVLKAMAAEAHAEGRKAVAITFFPHPKAVHDPAHPPELIMGLEDRIETLAETGLDGLLVVEYTLEFASQTPEEFVQNYFVDAFNAARVVVGRDARFGRGNAGDVETLAALGRQHGFETEIVADASGGHARRWSSTWARELLEAGDMRGAADVLGRPHRLRGVVVDGDKRGRTIGFPTANLGSVQGLIPRHGVYAATLTVLEPVSTTVAPVGVALPAAVSIGLNYTVGGDEVRVEAFVLDRDDLDLYGATVVLELVDWRRPMLDFGSLEAMMVELDHDVAWTREVLSA